jgi:hypothetical protein
VRLNRKNINLLSSGVPVFGIVCIGLYASTAGVFGQMTLIGYEAMFTLHESFFIQFADF